MAVRRGSGVRGDRVRRRRSGASGLWWAGAIIVALGAMWAGAPSPATAADWPIYGHDLSNSRNANTDGPSVSAVASMPQAWAFKSTNGDFTGTPVVAAGTVVAGTNLGSIFALDAVTGKVAWSKNIGQPINGSAAIDPNAPGGGVVLVPIAQLGAPQLLALSLRDGSMRWKAALSNQPSSANADVYGSPVYWNGTVYIGTSGTNGDDSTARGSVVALDEATGKLRWRTFTVPAGDDGGSVWSTPAIDVATGRLYVGTGNAYHPPAADTTDAMLVLDAATGNILGHFQAVSGDTFASNNPAGPDLDFGASPNLLRAPNGEALVGEGNKNGTYYALDRATMQPVWSSLIAPGSPVLGGITGSTADDGVRVFGSNVINSEIWALGTDGSRQWVSADGGTLDFSPVAVANGVLYTADPGGFLVARDSSTGAVLARFSLGGPTFGGISIAGGAVYVAVGTGPPPGSSQDGSGSIVAFGSPSRSGTSSQTNPATSTHPSIRLSVSPRSTHTGIRVRFHFHATSLTGGHQRAVAGASITFDGHRARTNARGNATITARLQHAGVYRARGQKSGFSDGHATVRATRASSARGRRGPSAPPRRGARAPGFTG
jgi:polyvinyl alcohol dehydrogenase (cytochrome)